ncbi:hypothetical protein KEM48_003593 [Puccinia striiformis f. sp. tritici PST-130]|nr:hypothetical protein KEM48_003593 [Puccinia striiformis f. sp. tritici PST-130]
MSNYLKLLFLRVCRYQSGEDIPPGPSNPNNLQGADEEKDERLDRDEKENEKKQIRAKAEENRKKEMIVGHLGNLPVEVIELIAVYVAIQVPFRPPTSLLNFATINKRFYQLLRPEQNDQLYASIFRNLFDVEALQRRFRNFSSSPTYPPRLRHALRFQPTSTLSPMTSINEPVNEVHAQLKNASDRDDDDDDLKTPPEDNVDDDGCKGGGGGGRRGGEEKAEVEGSSGGCCTGYCQATIFEEERKTRTTTKTDGNVCNNHLAAAYFERLDLFQRMRIFADHPAPNHPDERRFTDLEPYKDQPSIHLSGNHAMSLISQRRSQLDSPDQVGQCHRFHAQLLSHEINPSAVSPGYPSERPETAIALRLCHLFLDLQQEQSEPEFQSDSTSEDANYWTTEAGIETYLFALNLTLSHLIKSWLYGKALGSSTPTQSRSLTEFLLVQHPTHRFAWDASFRERRPAGVLPTDDEECARAQSVDYDREFARQTSCLDPFISPGLQFDSYQGCFKADGTANSDALGRIDRSMKGDTGTKPSLQSTGVHRSRPRRSAGRVLDGSGRSILRLDGQVVAVRADLMTAWTLGRALDSEIERLGRMKSLLYPIPMIRFPSSMILRAIRTPNPRRRSSHGVISKLRVGSDHGMEWSLSSRFTIPVVMVDGSIGATTPW